MQSCYSVSVILYLVLFVEILAEKKETKNNNNNDKDNSNNEVKVVPVVVGALGTILKRLDETGTTVRMICNRRRRFWEQRES